MLDTPTYFNGAVLEVELDVLLIVYMTYVDHYPTKLRAQRIGVTPNGPVLCT